MHTYRFLKYNDDPEQNLKSFDLSNHRIKLSELCSQMYRLVLQFVENEIGDFATYTLLERDVFAELSGGNNNNNNNKNNNNKNKEIE